MGSSGAGLGEGYIQYPRRAFGMDQARYPYRAMRRAPAMRWPGGARVGVWITVHVEWFPLDMPTQPVLAVGAIQRAYPDTQTYSARDYGNRVGIYRLMDAFAAHGVRPTAAINAAVAERYPLLIRAICDAGWEVMAAGLDMGHLHHNGITPDEERALVRHALAILRQATGQPVLGWHSPAFSQSAVTPELVADAGVRWMADWVNDEKPYEFALAGGGSLLALPAAHELSDTQIIELHSADLADFERQVLAAFATIRDEASPDDGRILPLSISPWLMGQPYRIAAMERILAVMFGSGDAIPVTAEQIAAGWQSAGPA